MSCSAAIDQLVIAHDRTPSTSSAQRLCNGALKTSKLRTSWTISQYACRDRYCSSLDSMMKKKGMLYLHLTLLLIVAVPINSFLFPMSGGGGGGCCGGGGGGYAQGGGGGGYAQGGPAAATLKAVLEAAAAATRSPF
ncbi:hypothetical protein NECAME_10869 [Necator americanus]|uniref:Uncharacterized protein n=1 Tax=Necator americanus TaxID=51031 RepID=W2T7X4_NECAM|nr:hypothetical protein NECAME_10869 [Necator americanus]ETN77719.1 hypothetical protein NECAME_10869 [Necator americanus]